MTVLAPADFPFPERLAEATIVIGETPLSRVAMINDHRFPWALIVPRLLGIEEFHHMTSEHRGMLIEEIAALSDGMSREFAAHRINVADIGNRVSQLHVHVVARKTDDAVWPKVVWSRPREVYQSAESAQKAALRLSNAASRIPGFEAGEVLL